MTQPTNTDLVFTFYFTSSGAAYDPVPDPTLTLEYPDHTFLSPAPELTRVRTGEWTFTLLAVDNTQRGVYAAVSPTLGGDVAVDGYPFPVPAYWEVGTNDKASIADAVWDEATADHVTAGSFGGFFAGLAASIFAYLVTSVTTAGSWAKYVYDTLAAILLKTNTIGTGVTFAQMPVSPDGRTQLVKGSTYKTAYGLALVYDFDGYPAFPLDGSCTWFAPARHSSVPFSKAGTIDTTARVHFELTYAEAASLSGNQCAIQVMLAPGDPIRTPNMPLDLLESVGA